MGGLRGGGRVRVDWSSHAAVHSFKAITWAYRITCAIPASTHDRIELPVELCHRSDI